MVNWMSPAEIARDGVVFSNMIHCLLGLYIWEWFISLPFDFSFILGKRRFRWPLIFYFMGRYALLFTLIGVAIALNVTTEINCKALYIFNALLGNVAIGCASINLSLRTIAVWSESLYITIPIVAIILGHWSLLLHGALVDASWVDGVGCVVTNTQTKILSATFIYSMCFDFIVLCLTGYKLMAGMGMTGRSRLVKLIFGDGLIFFVLAFLSNLLATVFLTLNLNPVMSIIFDVPAAIASTIVASRAVRRLTEFTHKGPEVFSNNNNQGNSTLAFRGGNTRKSTKKGEGVHVQMDTFTLAETTAHLDYDAAGKLKSGVYDPESQEISDEFKRPPY